VEASTLVATRPFPGEASTPPQSLIGLSVGPTRPEQVRSTT
jgi:hypothetical protein